MSTSTNKPTTETTIAETELLPCPFPEIYVQRFKDKVSAGSNGCWVWTGCRNNRGYGKLSAGTAGKTVLAHRRSYELFIGPIPLGQLVLHKCNNRPCVNPKHLYTGNQKQNMADSFAAGTFAVGERNGQSKLTEGAVRQIRSLCASGRTNSEISSALGIAYYTVKEVVRRRRWNHVQ